MGKVKYLREFRTHFEKRAYFTSAEAARFMRSLGAADDYPALMLYNLERRGELNRLKKGYYSFREDIDSVGFVFEPFYYGLQEALSIHGLWEQETNPVIMTTRRVRTGLRVFLGRNVVVHHINRKMFFGYEPARVGSTFVPVSDIEKTLIDFAYFRMQVPEPAMEKIRKRLDRKRLQQYLNDVDGLLRKKVLALQGR